MIGVPTLHDRAPADDGANGPARDGLLQELQRDAAATADWTGIKTFSPAVMTALARVPRHAFIPEEPSAARAYANRPQPIGFGQTISQPYIVALTSELIGIQPGARVLDVGAGSGYQAAVLAEMGAEVFSVERIPELAEIARNNLRRAGYAGVTVKTADGTRGWAEQAPFDAIVVAAAAEGPIPQALVEQLAPGGRMVIPTGPRFGPQMLQLGVKNARGRFAHRPILPVSFVPLIASPFSP